MQHLPLLPTKATLCAAVLLFCFSTEILSQRPAGSSSEAHICGVPAKQAEVPAGTPSEDIVFDRFGGSYSITEMVENAIFFTPLDCETSLDFILELDDRNGAFSEAESNVICDVFTYLSNIIDATSGEKAIIRLVKSPSLPSTVAATGSPYFPNDCGLGHSLVHRQLMIGGQPYMYHGFIEVNPSVDFYYEGNEEGENILSSQIDFYTLILHEALHVLGFGSQISSNGEPVHDFYTQWDLGLLSPNGENLIKSSLAEGTLCCSSYEFNPETNLSLPTDILNQTCGTTTFFNVSASAPVYGDYIGNDNGVFLNTLSHLNNDCTPGTKHVLNYRILAGESGVQRTLSTAESEILCFLGYGNIEICNDEPSCVNIANNDTGFFVAEGGAINITFHDLLDNDATNDLIPDLIEGCGDSDGITVSQENSSFEVSGISVGVYTFCYSITGCGGESNCDIATVKVVVTNPATTTACSSTDDCQLNPYYDFNIFGSGAEMRLALSNGISDEGSQGTGTNFQFNSDNINSPDFFPGGEVHTLFFNCNTTSLVNYEAPDGIGLVRFGLAEGPNGENESEGIVLPLCEPIMPNMSAEITFLGVSFFNCIEENINLEIDFTEDPPVGGQIIYENPGISIPTTKYPIIHRADFPNTNGRNSLVIHNNSNDCLNYLYMSAGFENGVSEELFNSLASILVGDVRVTLNNSLSEILNLNSTFNTSTPSSGDIIDIEIDLENALACQGSSGTYPPSTLIIDLPTGLLHEPNDDFPETSIFIDENELNPDRTYILRVKISDSVLSGQPLTINATMVTDDPCYNGEIISEIATLSPCNQPSPFFSAQLVDGECGVYNYISESSTTELIHEWYLNEQTENALFSTEANPTNHILPDGIHTIIHVLRGDCSTETFALQLPLVNCDNPLFTCPCLGDEAINLEAGYGTTLSQFIDNGIVPPDGINAKCLAINGHLLVDAASVGSSGFYEILQSEVKMQPGSSITIQAGGALSIIGNNSDYKVHGCEKLWRGIKLESVPDGSEGGRLYLGGAVIEDAVNAVELGDNTFFEMIVSTLNNNYRGIYMPESPSGDFQTVNQPTFPFLSSITSTGQLLPHYLGESQNSTNSYASIELNDCSGFQAGGGNLFGIIMSDANHGVVANNSNVSIFRSAIFDMVSNPLDFRSNSGIIAKNNSLIELRNSRLFNLNTGVFGIQSSLLLTENTIGEVSEDGIHGNIQNGIFLNTTFGNFVNISRKNQLHVNHNGISIRTAQRANSINIDDNTIEISPFPGGTGFGISLHDALMSGDNEDALNVTRNIINLREYGHGITLDNTNGVSMGQNVINYTSFADRDFTARGIWLALSSDNFLYDNSISGISSSDDLWGIDVIHGDRNKLCCNYIERTNIGTNFGGPCEGTILRHTAYINNNVGLRCGFNTRLGQQFAAGNTWMPTSSVQARHLSDEEEDITQSRFFAAGSAGSSTSPLNETQPTIGADWFVNGPTALSCEADLDNCEQPEINALAFNSILTSAVIEDRFLYGSYPETSDWEAKRAFYRSQLSTRLSDQSNWSSESVDYFQRQNQDKSTLHQLTVIDKSLEELHFENLDCTESETLIALLSEEIYNLDKTIVEGEEPSETYIAERANLTRQRNEAFIQYSNLLTQSSTVAAITMEQLRSDNDQVITNTEVSTTVKEINELYFNTLAKDLEVLPSSLELMLLEIAEKCPQRYGAAVIRAQSILKHYDKPFQASIECKEDLKGRKTNGSLGKKKSNEDLPGKDSDVVMFPNPVSGTLNILFPDRSIEQNSRIELTTSTGQVVLSKVSTGQQTNLDLSNYPAGLYWVRIQFLHKTVSKRLIIK